MTNVFNRSGVRRVCNDCNSDVKDDNSCRCDPVVVPFAKGDTVTVYASEGKPIGQSMIARIGNGAFRLKGSGSWYNLQTGKAHTNRRGETREDFVTPAQPGDPEAIAAERGRVKREADLAAAIREIDILRNNTSAQLAAEQRSVHAYEEEIREAVRRTEFARSRIAASKATILNLETRLARSQADIDEKLGRKPPAALIDPLANLPGAG